MIVIWFMILVVFVVGFVTTKFTRPAFRQGNGWWESYEHFWPPSKPADVDKEP
jgi:hypothetical protein